MSEWHGHCVFHVDLDAFYVSMELLRHPELRGRPVIVAGGLGPRAVVNTCSYEARRFGVGSAMPLSKARQLCPEADVLASDFAYYAPASRRFHAILRDFSPVIEPSGADEAYLDMTGADRLWTTPAQAAASIRARIAGEIGITASVGIAANKLVAKVASDAAKPDGICEVRAGEEAAFLAPLPVRDLPMVGPKTARRLLDLGLTTIGDLARAPAGLLAGRFGRGGSDLQARARGEYAASVAGSGGGRKSISREQTFGHDVSDYERLRRVLLRQADSVGSTLTRKHTAARTVTLKLRFLPFDTITRATSTGAPFLTAEEVFSAALGLFERAWSEHHRRPIRLIGVGVASLHERARQLQLGQEPSREVLADAVEEIRERYGRWAIRRAAEITPGSDGKERLSPFVHPDP